mmetsp:Transcript_20233/g.47558  ORF Transcript_20233/g.47558 Transcript_20233/m.47558 type:complete len:285 (+) Transcript_20233:184-1038(+)
MDPCAPGRDGTVQRKPDDDVGRRQGVFREGHGGGNRRRERTHAIHLGRVLQGHGILQKHDEPARCHDDDDDDDGRKGGRSTARCPARRRRSRRAAARTPRHRRAGGLRTRIREHEGMQLPARGRRRDDDDDDVLVETGRSDRDTRHVLGDPGDAGSEQPARPEGADGARSRQDPERHLPARNVPHPAFHEDPDRAGPERYGSVLRSDGGRLRAAPPGARSDGAGAEHRSIRLERLPAVQDIVLPAGLSHVRHVDAGPRRHLSTRHRRDRRSRRPVPEGRRRRFR